MREIVQSKLQLTSKEAVIKQMGYNNKQRGLDSLEKFLSSDLYSWLHSGNYDFKYAPLEFFKTLCKIIGISDEDVEKALQEFKVLDEELIKIKDCYIFINTNFKRVGESIWTLMLLQGRRKIYILKEKLLFKTDEEIFKTVSNIVREHYKNSNGKLLVWGEIADYRYHHKDGKIYAFDIKGELIDVEEVFESHASARV